MGNRNFKESRAPEDDRTSFSSDKPPRVYLSLGTSFNSEVDKFQGVINALIELGYPLTVACGGSQDLFDKLNKNKAENVDIQLFPNQRQLLTKMDIYFCHGGASSVYEAMYFRVPVLMLPQVGDQHANTTIMVEHKAG